jgi:glyoxylase-like metal-dependent hydrolase (beta-lactamase superfamily II)/8-oxo-dGTP pyrophosphatase MutT (NUDIX family)
VAIPLTRDEEGELRALVGRRNPKSRFLGGFFAFPGGVIEPGDGDVEAEGPDAVLRRTAARELLEETGITARPEELRAAGRRVTPPFSPRRFESPMYVTWRDVPEEPSPEDPGELLDLQWARPRDLVERWRRLEIRIAPPVLPMLDGLAEASAAGEGIDEIVARLTDINDDMEADGPRIEFVPDVFMIPLATPTLPPATHTNCYLVGSRDFLVLDPGSDDPEEIARLLRHVRRREASTGGRAAGVVLTHHHVDHVGGAAAVAGELGVPVRAHAETWRRWGGGGGLAAERRIELRDGETIELDGGERLRVLHTPGHAAGHVALRDDPTGTLFAGDLVSGVSTILIDSAPGSLDAYLESLERIRDSGATTLFPAHGPPLISPAKAVQRVIDHRAEREGRILDAVREGATSLDEIARRAYADTPDAPPGLASAQTAAHLERLERRGAVRAIGSGWTSA